MARTSTKSHIGEGMKITYRIDAYDVERNLETIWEPGQLEYMALDAARHHHECHDGWEGDWPLEIEILIDGKPQGVVAVAIEHRPVFNATVITS